MSAFLSISAALDGHLNVMPSLPPVAWENVPYTPDEDGLYLRPTLLAGDTVGASIGSDGSDEHVGVYQVDVFAIASTGKNAAITMADLIADHFKPSVELTHNGVSVNVVRVSRSAAIAEGSRYKISVDVRYQSFTTKR